MIFCHNCLINKTHFPFFLFSAILQRTAVDVGKIKLQSVATCMFLCMDGCGNPFASVSFVVLPISPQTSQHSTSTACCFEGERQHISTSCRSSAGPLRSRCFDRGISINHKKVKRTRGYNSPRSIPPIALNDVSIRLWSIHTPRDPLNYQVSIKQDRRHSGSGSEGSEE